MIRRILAVLFAITVALVPSVMTVGPAYAYSGPHYWMYTDDGDPGGIVHFWPYGDVFAVCDIQADGVRAMAQVWNFSKDYKFEYEIQAVGNGECTTVKASMGQPWNLAEGDCMYVAVWLRDGDGTGNVGGSTDAAYWWNRNGDKYPDCY